MSPVVDCDTDEDVDTKMLTMPVSPFSESDNADEAVCSSLSAINRLSSSFPSCSLSRALRDVQPDDMQVDPLSMSCFAELRLDRLSDDGDLTSLDWLQDINLLRNISPDVWPNSDPSMLVDDAHKENAQVSCYHPKHNPCGKPPYSFSVLIFMAIESSPQRRLPVKQIYEWIANQFPFYRRAPLGWRNSVRHNLSLNKCFRKVEKACGKGSSWCVDPFFRPNLLQAMKRTPYFPYQQIQMTSVATAEVLLDNCFTDLNSEECETTAAVGMPCDVDMDVAATLASLGSVRVTSLLSERDRKLLKIRSVRNLPELVCTPPPYKDHVYGFAESLVVEAQQAALTLDCDMESPVDEVYDFGEICCESEVSDSTEALSDEDSDSSRSRRHSIISRRCWMMPEDVADEEEQRRLEGVRALLNLASGTKGDRQKKARSLSLSRSLWAKAGNTTRLKKQRKNRKQLGKVQTNKSLHKMKGKRKVVRRRTR